MSLWAKERFKPERSLNRYYDQGLPFGIVMRSIPYLCCDIDGKNGGIQTSRILALPRTLAERSKSGNGFHIFYRIPESVWDPAVGYAEFPDVNGLLPGIDIRATGIVYHYPTQWWNTEEIAPLPMNLRKLLEQRVQTQRAIEARKEEVNSMDPVDLAMAQADVLDRLAGPIDKGRRNTALFAIGCELRRLQVQDWQDKLIVRGEEIGLSRTEVSVIVRHVIQYT